MSLIKLFAVGHSYVVKEYQKALDILGDNGFAITLLTPDAYKEGGRYINASTLSGNIKHYRFSTLFGKQGKQHFHIYINLLKIAYLFMINKPDILYLYEEPNSLVTLEFVLLSKIFSRKTKIIIWTSNDVFRNYKKIYKFYDIRRYLFDFNIKINSLLTDASIATSVEAKDVLRRKKYFKKIYITHTHAIDLNFLFPINKQNEIFQIGFIGRLEYQKGLQILLKAINVLKKHHKIESFRLLVYGDGGKKNEFMKYCNQNNLNQNILWRGFYNYNELNSIMNSFDILVVPSITDGVVKEKFGRVIIEGMACGIPVIVSNSGGMPYVGGVAVKKFEEGDHIELSNLIMEFLKNHQLIKEYSQLGLYRVKNFFSYNAVSSSFYKIFKDLLSDYSSSNEIYINNYRVVDNENSHTYI
ncbi:glycosyltransferase family 4 protein [Campylobacter sp. MOP7]|uniref:glycosyltransferase family 4 protein n=1 Tax=Campylobacter canis TaxID=3378588 RepID=UPI00387E31FD